MADPATPPKTAAYPQLNLQPTMSCSSLCLETPPFNRNHIDRLIICSLRRSPSQTICSDSYKTETKRPLHSLFPFEFEEADPTVLHSPVKAARKVVRSPYKVLDAPALQDDFYLNLVDWSSHNVLAVGLESFVYLWNACSSKIWDASHCNWVRTMEGHRLRVGSLAWSSSALSTGSHDKSILQRDLRAQDDSLLSCLDISLRFVYWSFDHRELASSGNDNKLFVNQHSTQPVLKFCEHTAAV
ncbi:hypothetical protein CRG98_048060 [Punica granatum]|uniref:Anaphase-promoting complex subunit 4 WD40 domain-containing protein n=1 Tax=Punica granatum TaxID=22663 RepID=A0A2I0HIP5_PUNGR|nr:hypothetical protein CRG98_048060 [Punica granatum]